MGLISGLLTLPLAPVRGTAWIAEQVRQQAESELYDEGAIQAELMELQAAHEAGEVDDEELARAEDALLERLMVARGLAGEETGGGLDER
jgi:Gas vesicle protein G